MDSERFTRYRLELGMTQRQLAEEIGRSRAMVINYESTHKIPKVTALALERVIQVHRMKLFIDDVKRFKDLTYSADDTIRMLEYFIDAEEPR